MKVKSRTRRLFSCCHFPSSRSLVLLHYAIQLRTELLTPCLFTDASASHRLIAFDKAVRWKSFKGELCKPEKVALVSHHRIAMAPNPADINNLAASGGKTHYVQYVAIHITLLIL